MIMNAPPHIGFGFGCGSVLGHLVRFFPDVKRALVFVHDCMVGIADPTDVE